MLIEIFDTGSGIPSDKLDVIFEAFRQLDDKREGLGLGLSIVRQTAELLGHELSVRSMVGRGSRFIIEVPRARGGASRSGHSVPSGQLSPATPEAVEP